MLDLCAKFAFDNDFVFNGKKSCCMAVGRTFDLIIGRMMIGTEYVDWVKECVYLGVKLISSKVFTTVVDSNKRKFYAAFNDVMFNGSFLSEECLMEIFAKQCIPILMYGAGNWRMNVEEERKVCVCFNRAVRRVFGYKDYESVREILFGFSIIAADLFIKRVKLLLNSVCIRSDRLVLKRCAEWQRDRACNLTLIMKYGLDYKLSKCIIYDKLWEQFVSTCD